MNVALLEKKLHKETLRSAESVRVALGNASENEAVPALLEIAENEEQKRRTLETVRWSLFAFSLTLCLVHILLLCFVSARWVSWLMPLSMGFPQIPLLFTYQGTALQNAAVALLRFPNEPRSVRPMVDLLHVEQAPEVKSLLYPELTERLWNLPAADTVLQLDGPRRAALRRFLTSAFIPSIDVTYRVYRQDFFDAVATDLAVAVMKTLAQIGDAKAVSLLRKIAATNAKTPNEAVVRDAASEYLPILIQKTSDNKAIEEKIQRCTEGYCGERQKALADFLDTLGPENAKAALFDYLQVALHRATKIRVACLVGFVCLTLLDICFLFSGVIHSAGLIGGLGAVFAIGINMLLSYARHYPFALPVQIAVKEMSRRAEGDVRFVGILARFAQDGLPDEDTNIVKNTLARLLPMLQPGDTALVPPASRAYLRSWLKTPLLARFKKGGSTASQTKAIIALNALGTIGDKKTLRHAERIARDSRDNYREAALQKAALRCVEALQKRRT